jgi:chloride channel 7
MERSPNTTYNVLRGREDTNPMEHEIYVDLDEEQEELEELEFLKKQKHRNPPEKEPFESLDFTDCESMMWRKHQFRRYFQEKGRFWTKSRLTTTWKWILTILTGLLVGATGAFTAVFSAALSEWKFQSCYSMLKVGDVAAAFFSFQFFCLFFVLIASGLCWFYPAAAGSGIPEIKAFLNGVNLRGVVQFRVLVTKVIGMCFSVASGLPLGKEGPMVHSGSIIGGLVSQGYTFAIGYDNSWSVFQDLRNDYTKRDYITYGAAAGIAAAFRAPIGGILFTLEDGASFWSTTTTIRSFLCAVVTQLSMGLCFPHEATSSLTMFAFGQFDNLFDGRSNYYVYELPLFMLMGVVGGVLGAFFNHLNLQVNQYRMAKINISKRKRIKEVICICLTMSLISFLLPLCWPICTPLSAQVAYTKQENFLLDQLVEFTCSTGSYNQLASLYFTPDDMAIRQLFHFREVNGEGLDSFSSGPLILFFIPYFFMAAMTAGCLVPAGLFVPTLCAGAAYGRLIGHWMNMWFPGHVADAGTYALVGAASIFGGNSRMTIAGCVILLEACGNITYLLPLMVTFAMCRYTGNAINGSIYDMQIHLKGMPFLEDSLHSMGMLNYHPIAKIMSSEVKCLQEIEKVSKVMELLHTTEHNGFPVINREGKLRGLILRKTLCTLLKLKAYSTPIINETSTITTTSDSLNNNNNRSNLPRTLAQRHANDISQLLGSQSYVRNSDGGILLQPAATVGYDILERPYPHYPEVTDVKLSDRELVRKKRGINDTNNFEYFLEILVGYEGSYG